MVYQTIDIRCAYVIRGEIDWPDLLTFLCSSCGQTHSLLSLPVWVCVYCVIKPLFQHVLTGEDVFSFSCVNYSYNYFAYGCVFHVQETLINVIYIWFEWISRWIEYLIDDKSSDSITKTEKSEFLPSLILNVFVLSGNFSYSFSSNHVWSICLWCIFSTCSFIFISKIWMT